MLYKTIVAVLSVTFLVNGELLDRDTYLQVMAPKALAKIQEYRTQHLNLTLPQQNVLTLAENIVNEFSTDDLKALEAMCVAAFNDKQECDILLGDDSVNTAAPRQGKLKRAPNCECSTGYDYCYMGGTIDRKCHRGENNGQCDYSSGK